MAPGDLEVPPPTLTDSELVYRRVLPDHNHWSVTPDGEFRISSSAFYDKVEEPSVDRALICAKHGGTAHTQQQPSNGVLELPVKKVRAISSSKFPLSVDVKSDPCPAADPTNAAHCLIVHQSELATRAPGKRVREGLALVAKWKRMPGSDLDLHVTHD
jgi:hypothetical protein